MDLVYGSVATLAVAIIYCLWHAYLAVDVRRRQTLRERVAFMLWRVAEHGP